MIPEDWFDRLKGYEAIFFGAVGWPQVVPDHVSLWGSLIRRPHPYRRGQMSLLLEITDPPAPVST